MKGLGSWINIVNLAKEEMDGQRAIIKKLLSVLKAYHFYAQGGGALLEDYKHARTTAERVIREAEEMMRDD